MTVYKTRQLMMPAQGIFIPQHYNIFSFRAGIKRAAVTSDMPLDIEYHCHEDVGVILVEKGQLVFDCKDSKAYIRTGDVAALRPHVLHRIVPEKSLGCRYLMCYFDPNLLMQIPIFREKIVDFLYMKNHIGVGVELQNGSEDAAELGRAIGRLWDIINRKVSSEGEAIALIQYIFSLVYKASDWFVNDTKSGMKTSSQKLMIAFINRHYSEKIKLSDIARAGNVSVTKCCSLFREYVNKSPMEYTNDYRLKTSMAWLAYSDYSIAEISTQCGFFEQEYFVKFFRRMVGITPLQYRKQLRNLKNNTKNDKDFTI